MKLKLQVMMKQFNGGEKFHYQQKKNCEEAAMFKKSY